ncbi:MAG: UbiA family prenyltransferase [Methanobacteriota archaeon]|nr:MAG: UbiA family prenyltransferase [Euryarchaeota archaeon]
MTAGEWSSTALGLVTMMRLGNCLMAAAGALLGALICLGAGDASEYFDEIALSMLVVFLFTAAGNSMNDYFDRDVDCRAHPERPIPRSLVRPRDALMFAVLLFSLSVLLGLVIGAVSFVIVVASLAVMVSYEVILKQEGLAGNLAISWLTGALFLFGGAAVENLDLAWILAILAFLATLGREIIKDVQDIEADLKERTTLPMRIGEKNAGVASSAALLTAVALSPAPYLLGQISAFYLPIVAVADAIFIFSSIIHFKNPERGQRMTKLAMFVALCAFLAGGVP